MQSYENEIVRLRAAIEEADAVVVGAGAGLSTAAGFTYAGERFERLFPDFIKKYGFRDRSILIDADIDAVLDDLFKGKD